ncbi:hypothetical protein ICA_01085 [Bacillus cereus BAG1O-3]|nr:MULTISPECIES: hypothetical protein [Bacillus]EPF14683.1 hypothetical protein ICA_01085 [Bacillus cereus BAG1O-3]MDR4412789.1 hypothetical protein [Bacillus thuringiensis]PFG76688.1 hypothetical protein DL97_3939 [Bacillus sp. YF23]PGV80463.1 hypothetical protein COD83_09870 [Bacillus thuringiensis]
MTFIKDIASFSEGLSKAFPIILSISSFLGVLIIYNKKTNFDLIFEGKHIRFLTKMTQSITAFIGFYLLFQFVSFSLYFIGLPKPTKVKLNTIYTIDIMLVFILIISILIYIVFKIIRTALNYLHTINSYQNFINKKNEWLNQHNKTKNALIFIKNGIIFMYLGLNKLIYIILVVASLLTQAMHFYLAKEQILKFDLTSQQAIQFLVGPIVIWVFLIAIMYLYLKEIGELKKVYYTVKFISETNVKNEELIHLHTRSTKEWVLVRVNDLQEQNTIFLYNPETKNWLEYNKVIHD